MFVPTDEQKVLVELFQKHRKELSQDKDAVQKLVTVGYRPAPVDVDPIDLAAWTSVSRAILNLHEAITRN